MFAQRYSTVCERSQPFATVRNVRVIAVWPCHGKFCRRVVFEGFKRRVASFRLAGVALRDIQTFFGTASKIVLCGRCKTFTTFSQDELQFSWQARHFGRVQHHFAWQAQHFRRVVLRVFCESHCQGCVKWRQGEIPWQVDGSLARNIDFEVANLEVPKKTRRKISILKLHSVKIGGSLA